MRLSLSAHAVRQSRPKPVGLANVARAAGVSLSTASRALRDHPEIARATCARVRLWAVRLGYRPNPLVRCLMAQVRSGHVPDAGSGLAFLDFSPAFPAEPASAPVSRFLAGAEARAHALGFRLTRLCPVADRFSPTDLVAALSARGLRGVLLPAHATPAPYAAGLAHLAVVALGGEHPLFPFATPDRYMSGRLARRRIRELGYVRPGLVVDPHDELASASQLQAGFYSDTWPRPDLPVPVLPAGPDAAAAFARWYRTHRPDCVVASHARVHLWLQALGTRIPDDTAFVLLDRDAASAGIAGIDQRSESVAAAAVESLTGQIERNSSGPAPIVHGFFIPGAWHHGPSAPALAAPAEAKT